VFRALAARRNLDGKDIQPVIEVPTKFFPGHHHFEVAIGGSYNLSFLSSCSHAPETLVFPLLQNTEQLRLESQWDIANFVQKQHAVVRQLQPAWLRCDCTREGAPLVSEELSCLGSA